MIKFPSTEWINTAQTVLNESEEVRQAARKWDGDFLFIMEKDQELNKDFNFYFKLTGGNCSDAQVIDEKQEATCILSGPYSIWKKILNNKLPNKESNFLSYVIEKKMKLIGDYSLIMKNISLLKILTNLLSSIESGPRNTSSTDSRHKLAFKQKV